MRLAVPACIALAALACLSSNQTPPGKSDKPGETLPPTRSKPERVFIKAIEDQMQGAWRLTAFESPFLEKEYRQDVGFMVVSGNYFSLEMHLGWTVANGAKLDHRDFISGTHRFEVDERGRMTTSTVIGPAFDKHGNTADLIFSIPFLVSHISRIMTLEPGDVIATGTPAGVAPVTVGDRIEVEVGGVGVLENRVEPPAS